MKTSDSTTITIMRQSEPNAMVGGDLLGKNGLWMTPVARGATTTENAMVDEKFVRQSVRTLLDLTNGNPIFGVPTLLPPKI